MATKPRRPVPVIPSLEQCEPRLLLSTITAHWVGGSGNWSDGFNWDVGQAPDNAAGDNYNVFVGVPGVVVTVDGNYDVSSLTNAETIIAAGNALAIDGAVSNTGELRAREWGRIHFGPALVNNSGGAIVADGGTVDFSASQVTGGTITATDLQASLVQLSGDVAMTGVTWQDPGLGEFQLVDGPAHLGGDLARGLPAGWTLIVTYGGELDLPADRFTNNGFLEIRQANGLRAGSNTTIAGTGTIRMASWGAAIAAPGGVTLTLGPQQTLTGAGEVRVPLVNQGLVLAEAGGRIAFTGDVVNQGAMRAYDFGTLDFDGVTVTGAGHSIVADGGWVHLTDTTVNAGTLLATDNDLSWFVFRGSVTLNGVGWQNVGAGRFLVMGDPARLLGDQAVPAGATLEVLGGAALGVPGGVFHNDGVIKVSGSGSRLDLLADATLQGGGQVLLSDGTISGGAGVRLTVAGGMTIRGSGQITVPVTNYGTIQADDDTEALTLTQPLTNEGLLSAVADATFDLNADVVNQGNGRLQGDDGSRFAISGNFLAVGSLPQQKRLWARLELDGAGTAGSPQKLEVTGSDVGSTIAGLAGGLGTLVIGPNNIVRLVDASDNAAGTGAEALYATAVEIAPSSTLDLAGLHFYCLSTSVAGAVTGGSVLRLVSVGEELYPGVSYDVGNQPRQAAIGDINGDGRPDMVAATNLGVSVLLGQPDGHFAAGKDLAVPGSVQQVALADATGDGRLDLVSLEWTVLGQSQIVVRRGLGNGTFADPVATAVNVMAEMMAVGDINGDGRPDVIVDDWAGKRLLIYRNTGGSFAPAGQVTVGAAPNALLLVDVNGDGRSDLVAANNDGENVSVMLGNGNATFRAAVLVSAGSSPMAVAAGDVDGDGKVDLAVGTVGEGKDDYVVILAGRGDGTFSLARTCTVGSWPETLAVADVDGDGYADVLAGNSASNDVSILYGLGHGDLADQVLLPTGLSAKMTVADLNGDGRPDIVTANRESDTLTVLSNLGQRRFAAPQRLGTGDAVPQAVVAADVNRDGRPDLIAIDHYAHSADRLRVLLGNGDGTFAAPLYSAIGSGLYATALAVGDFNGDGLVDVVTADNNLHRVTVLLGDGHGAFTRTGDFLVAAGVCKVAVGDFNGDGMADVAAANQGDGSISILLGSGDGRLAPATNIAVGARPGDLAAADLNGDGADDLVVFGAGSHLATVLLAKGDGTFASTACDLGTGVSVGAVADINGDGRADIVAAGAAWIAVAFGDGTGRFGPAMQAPMAHAASDLLAADVNGDALPDVVVAGDDASVSLLLGLGDGSFVPGVSFAAGSGTASLAAADLNGDGWLDLVTANADLNDGTLSVLLNSGAGGVVSVPSGRVNGPISSVRLRFGDPMDTASFSLADIVGFTGPGGAIAVSGFSWLSPRWLELRFATQQAPGAYRLELGPQVLTTSGRALDGDHDGTGGEDPADRYVLGFTITAPQIILHQPAGLAAPPVSSVRLEFDRAMNQGSFALSDIVSLTGPHGAIKPRSFAWLNSRMLEIRFDAQTDPGQYGLVLSPQVLDQAGLALDSDGDGMPGENVQDRYTASWSIAGPRIISQAPPDDMAVPQISVLMLTFDHDMNAATLTASDVSIVGPTGPLTVTSVLLTGARNAIVRMTASSAPGEYAVRVGPQVADKFGYLMDQDSDGIGGEADDAYVGTMTCGSPSIMADTTWSPDDGPIVVGPVVVLAGVTLTIQAGTVVKFLPGGQLTVLGQLKVEGAPQAPVIFTSVLDDLGGASEGAFLPGMDDWDGLRLEGDDASAQLTGLAIRHATTGLAIDGLDTVDLSQATIADCATGIEMDTGLAHLTARNVILTRNALAIDLRNNVIADLTNVTLADNELAGDIGNPLLTLDNSIVARNAAGFEGSFQDVDLNVQHTLFFGPLGSLQVWSQKPAFAANGNLLADPLFVDAAAGDLGLGPRSPAVDAARGGTAPATDLRGKARRDDLGVPNTGSGAPDYADLGALERQDQTVGVNLAVTSVGAPSLSVAQPGDTLTVGWSVANQGLQNAQGPWVDVVYLAAHPYPGPGDVELGRVTHAGSLKVGESYTQSLTAAVPATSGPLYVLVRTNATATVSDVVSLDDTGASPSVVAVSVPVLSVGGTADGTVQEGQWAFFRLPAGTDPLHLALTSDSGGQLSLYARFGLPPTLSSFATSASQAGDDQDLRLAQPLSGDYYVGVYRPAGAGPAAFTVSAEVPPFAVRAVSPGVISWTGRSTVRIDGDRFDPSAQVTLVSAGGTVLEAQEVWQDSCRLFATFDLAAPAPVGMYDVVVTNAGGAQVGRAGAVEVVDQAGAGELTVSLTAPSRTRPGRVVELLVDFANTGTADLPAPLLTLDAGVEDCQWRLPGSDVWADGRDFRVLALSPDGPATTLRPGQSGTLTVEMRVPLRIEPLDVTLSSSGTGEEAALPIDWATLEQALRPDSFSDAEWLPVLARLHTLLGTTWGDYASALRTEADRWAAAGRRVMDAGELFDRLMDQALGLPTGIVAGTVRSSAQGTPVSGATVSAVGQGGLYVETTTDAQGRFLLYGLPSGPASVSVARYFTDSGAQPVLPAQGDVLDWPVQVTEAGHLTGRVAGDAGEPIAGARVVLASDDGSTVLAAVCDDQGQFRFDALAAGTYTLTAGAAGLLSHSQPVAVSLGATTAAQVSLSLGAAMAGKATSSVDGSAVSGALVLAVSTTSGDVFAAMTDSAGAYRLAGLPADTYTVQVRKEGFAESLSAAAAVAAGETRQVSFALDRGARVTGHVVDADTGLPIAGAEVSLYAPALGTLVSLTDAAGQYVLPGAAAAAWSLEASMAGYQPGEAVSLTVTGAETIVRDLQLRVGAGLTGTITDPTGQPVTGASVRATGPDGSFFYAASDAAGGYSLQGLAAGVYSVLVQKGGLAAQRLTTAALVPGAPAAVLDVQLTAGVGVAGHVTALDGATPIGGALVRLQAPDGAAIQATAGAAGEFSAGGVAPGVYYLRVSADGWCGWQQTIDVPAGGYPALDVRLGQGGTVAGDVAFGDGQMVAGAKVDIYTADRSILMSVRTDGSGSFALTQVPAGNYFVQVYAWETAFAPVPATVTEGGNTAVHVAAGSGEVHGTVRAAGAAVPSPRVLVLRQGGDETPITVTGAADGTYQIENLADGTYVLIISGGGLARAIRNAVVAQGGSVALDVDLSPGLSLSGVVTDAAGSPFAGAIVQAWSPDGTDRDDGLLATTDGAGAYTLAGLAAGTYTLRVYAVGQPVYQATITVPDQVTADVQFAAAGRTLSLTIVDAATGQPVPNATGLVFRGDFPVGIVQGGEDGTAAVEHLADGDYRIDMISPAIYRTPVFTVSGDASREIDLALGAMGGETLAASAPMPAPALQLALAQALAGPVKSGPSGGGNNNSNTCSGGLSEETLLMIAYAMLQSWGVGYQVSSMHLLAFLNKHYDVVTHRDDIAVAKIKAESVWQNYDLSFRHSWIRVDNGRMYNFSESDGSDIVKQWVQGGGPTSFSVHTGYVPLFKTPSDTDLTWAYGGINGIQTNLTDIQVDLGSYEEDNGGGQLRWKFNMTASAEYILEDSWKMLEGMEESWIGLTKLQNCFGYAIDDTRTYLKYPDWDSFGYVNVYKVSIRQTTGGKVTMSGYAQGLADQDGDEDHWKFTEGTEVTFSATPEKDYRLVKWNNGPQLTIGAPEMVSAKFEKKKKKPEPPLKPLDKRQVDVRTSLDPQDAWGPAGYDAPETPAGQRLRYVRQDQTFTYRVEMWNKPEALVPTQDATVSDTLDPALFDLSTFQFTRAGFLKWDVQTATQALDVRLDAPDLGIVVEITGSINLQTGQVDWLFHSMDPLTGQTPANPDVGFLPPYNPATGYEIAWVEFTVKPKAGLATGAVVGNQAFTQFDFFGPVGPAPEAGPWTNTIDASTPASAVAALPAITTTADFPVQWSGSDTGSGVVAYDVYVASDGGAYQPWQSDVTATSAVFHGQGGHSYAFYGAARDGVGHVEAAPALPDAATTVHVVSVVGTLSTGPDRPVFDGPIALTADNLTSGDAAADAVEFAVADAGGVPVNLSLGADTDGADGWHWSGAVPGLSAGPTVFQARVRDADGVWGPWAQFTLPVYRTTPVAGKAVSFTDGSGDLVTVSLTGGGTATLYFAAAGHADLSAIVCDQTKVASKLSITSKGRTTLGGLEASGPLGTISAATTSLSGRVAIGAAADPKAAVTMAFDRIADADFELGMPVKALTATDWLNTDQTTDWLRAPWVGALTTTGRKASAAAGPAVSGDFQACLEVGTGGLLTDSTVLAWTPLGTVSVAGTIDGATFTAKGWNASYVSIASLKAGRIGDLSVSADSGIGKIATSAWQSGAITAGRIGTLAVSVGKTAGASGDFGANITLTGAFLGNVALGKSGLPGKAKALASATVQGGVPSGTWDVTGQVGTVTIAGAVGADGNCWAFKNATAIKSLSLGDVVNGTVAAAGAINSLTAKRWQAGSLAADSLGALSAPGAAKTAAAAAIPGDFLANLALTGAGVAPTASVLGSANIKGGVGAATWNLSGKVGAVTVGGTVGAVAAPWRLIGASSVGKVTLGDVINASVTVSGSLGGVKATRWLDGAIQAATVASITATGRAATKTAPAIPGDWGADVTLTGASPKPLLPALTVAGWLDGSAISSAGALGTLTVGGLRSSTITAGDLAGTPATRMAVGSLTVKGIAGETAVVLGSSLSAWTLGAVTLRDVTMSNAGTAFGVTGHTLAAYTRYAGKTVIAKASKLAGPLAAPVDADTDFAVELI